MYAFILRETWRGPLRLKPKIFATTIKHTQQEIEERTKNKVAVKWREIKKSKKAYIVVRMEERLPLLVEVLKDRHPKILGLKHCSSTLRYSIS